MPRVLLVSLTLCSETADGKVQLDQFNDPVLHMALKDEQVSAFQKVWNKGMAFEGGQPEVMYEFSDKMAAFLNKEEK